MNAISHTTSLVGVGVRDPTSVVCKERPTSLGETLIENVGLRVNGLKAKKASQRYCDWLRLWSLDAVAFF